MMSTQQCTTCACKQHMIIWGLDGIIVGVVGLVQYPVLLQCMLRYTELSFGSRQSRHALGLLLQVEAYALSRGYPDSCSFADVLQQFDLEAQQEDLYFLCNQSSLLAIARATDGIAGLTLSERHQLCCAPVDDRATQVFDAFVNFVRWFGPSSCRWGARWGGLLFSVLQSLWDCCT